MLKKFIASFGGIGLLPGMPGSYASLIATVIYALIWQQTGDAVRFIIAPLTLVVAVVALVVYKDAAAAFKKTDPRQFVLDEVVGQWIALLCLPLSQPANVPYLLAVGFFMFRGFDVAKPWPVSLIDQRKDKWGALLDDVAAGIYAVMGSYILMLIVESLVTK